MLIVDLFEEEFIHRPKRISMPWQCTLIYRFASIIATNVMITLAKMLPSKFLDIHTDHDSTIDFDGLYPPIEAFTDKHDQWRIQKSIIMGMLQKRGD